MFSDNKNDKVAYFGVWADAAGDYRLRREALRLCTEAANRCFDQDFRTCKEAPSEETFELRLRRPFHFERDMTMLSRRIFARRKAQGGATGAQNF